MWFSSLADLELEFTLTTRHFRFTGRTTCNFGTTWMWKDLEGQGGSHGPRPPQVVSPGTMYKLYLSLVLKLILVLSHQLELLNLTAGLPPQVVEKQVQRSLVSDQVHLFHVLLQAGAV